MEAGPRDRPRRRQAGGGAPRLGEPGLPELSELSELSEAPGPLASGDPDAGHAELRDDDAFPADPDGFAGHPRDEDLADGLPDDLDGGPPPEQSFQELRPPRRLRIWQLVPIVALGTIGSLMFAFPLAFEPGDGGPVVAMLGLLLSCCCAGWAIMAARRVGYTWPGLPVRGSGERPDWRFVTGYALFAIVVAVLAVWRVARLR